MEDGDPVSRLLGGFGEIPYGSAQDDEPAPEPADYLRSLRPRDTSRRAHSGVTQPPSAEVGSLPRNMRSGGGAYRRRRVWLAAARPEGPRGRLSREWYGGLPARASHGHRGFGGGREPRPGGSRLPPNQTGGRETASEAGSRTRANGVQTGEES
jgi:hypothetical protein